jgi:cation transport regulator ChaC
MAYQPDPGDTSQILESLDYREKGGYERHPVTLQFEDNSVTDGIMYVATKYNANYLGPASPQEMAWQIARAKGPSGTNVEYLLKLAKSLEEMGGEDAHVTELVQQLTALDPG